MVNVADQGLVARLVLEPAEMAALRACLPASMRDDSEQVVRVDETVLAGLRARGVFDENDDVHRSVLAPMVLLADPGAVRFSVVAASAALARRTTLALSDTMLAGLTVEEPSGRSEQLLAATGSLGSELTRLLPTLHERPSPGRQTLRGIHPGRLQVAVEAIQTAHQLRENPLDEASLGLGVAVGEALADDLRGSFMVTLMLPAGLIADSPVLDRVLWVDTANGWYAMRPGSDRDGEPRLDVVPVEPDDIGPELAPLVAAAALALGGAE